MYECEYLQMLVEARAFGSFGSLRAGVRGEGCELPDVCGYWELNLSSVLWENIMYY